MNDGYNKEIYRWMIKRYLELGGTLAQLGVINWVLLTDMTLLLHHVFKTGAFGQQYNDFILIQTKNGAFYTDLTVIMQIERT
jgi:hypothetical protein